MRKFFLLIFFIFFSCAFANAEGLEDFAGIDNAWDGQKAITNKEFEQAIDTLQAKQKKKEEKQRKKHIKKVSGGGTSLHSGLDPMSEINIQDPLKKHDDEGQLINIPIDFVVDGKIRERGFYNVFAEKDKKDGKIYISFYQAHYPLGKIRGYETDDDYGAEELNFVKYEQYNDRYLKIMYGSLDFNAYGYLEQWHENSEEN